MSGSSLCPSRTALLSDIRQAAAGARTVEALQQAVVGVLSRALAHYSWTGFYMVDSSDPETLILGPFLGAQTPHLRIPLTQGICGAAVASGQTIIVDDVSADPRYLSCSIDTKSEIVVPIYAHGKVIGEIDIDSHDPAAFTGEDKILLEEIAQIIGMYVEEHDSPPIP